MQPLSVISYNCKHFRDRGPKFDFICNISKECDMLLMQEHCLYKRELNKMCKLGDGMAITGKISMDECFAREGRPYGGCAILWKLSLKSEGKELKCNHVRLCEIMIQINNCEIMCLNVYVPCDGWSEDDKFAEYMDVLSEIQQLIHTYYPGHVIYGGDWNTDLTRIRLTHMH